MGWWSPVVYLGLVWLHSDTHCWRKKKISAGTWLPFGKDIDLTGVCYVVALCCTLLKKKKKILCRHMVALWERYWHICVLLFGCTLHSFEGRHLYRYVMAMVMAVLWLKLFKILLIFTTVWLWFYDITARLIGCCVPDLQSMYYRWPSTPRQCGLMITCGISWPR